MPAEKCQICGNKDRSSLAAFPIVPPDIAAQTGKKARTVDLCLDCRRELQRWFLSKIAQTAYDVMAQEFRPKTPQRLAAEYDTAYQWFVKLKPGLQARVG